MVILSVSEGEFMMSWSKGEGQVEDLVFDIEVAKYLRDSLDSAIKMLENDV